MRLIFIFGLLFIFSCRAQDEKDILALFEKEKNAEMNGDAKALLDLADRNSIDYFEKIKNISLKSDSLSVRSLNLFDKNMVLTLRGKLTLEVLNAMTSADLFVYYFKSVIGLKSAIEDRIINNLKISGNSACAELNSKAIPFTDVFIVKFNKERDDWKYDFTSYFEINNHNLEKMNKMFDTPEDDYLREVLPRKGVTKPYSELWLPLEKTKNNNN
jgi:hypothetical protein